jgi:hypothetical protein
MCVDSLCRFLSGMGEADKDDPAYCRSRAADFRAKAKVANGWLMKQAL